MSNWHTLDQHSLELSLETPFVQGLSDAQAAHRLIRYGANEIIDKGAKSSWRILWGQLTAYYSPYSKITPMLIGNYDETF
jgi:P-type Ca2+ transporter type 2C